MLMGWFNGHNTFIVLSMAILSGWLYRCTYVCVCARGCVCVCVSTDELQLCGTMTAIRQLIRHAVVA